MKRVANVQLTHESISDEGEAESGSFKKASEDPLKKKSSELSTGLSFTGVSAFNNSSNSSFNTVSTSSTLSMSTEAKQVSTEVQGSDSDAKAMEIRGLNTSFLNYVSKCVKEDCFADLSKVCQEYTTYLSKIEKDYPKKQNIELGPLPVKNQTLPLTINFGGGAKQESLKPVTLNSTPSIDKVEKPVFNFGATVDTPAFTFGNKPPAVESASFKFGNGKIQEKTEGDVGGKVVGDKFSFGGNAPLFSFTPKTNESEKPTFKFNSSESSTVPFSSPFNFQPKSEQSGFQFSSLSAPSFSTPSAPVASIPINTTDAGESAINDEENEIVQEEQVGDALMVANVGEEGEVTLFSIRSKVRKFVDGKWEIIGLGLLKVNQNQSSKSSRIILRSESGKVLLNVSIFSEMTVCIKENTSVNFSASLSPGSLTPLSAKVKEKKDATALLEAIEKAKSKN